MHPQPSDALADLVAFVGDAKIIAHNAESSTERSPRGTPAVSAAREHVDRLARPSPHRASAL